ncbi:acyl-CoA dehydrogenase family protein, partial [Pseudomonas amygdali pv. mori str. 301020]
RWKYQAVGTWHLNGTLPARHSWIVLLQSSGLINS